MGSLDKADMLSASYGVGGKSKKWWHQIFIGLSDCTIANAAIACEKDEKKAQAFLILVKVWHRH